MIGIGTLVGVLDLEDHFSPGVWKAFGSVGTAAGVMAGAVVAAGAAFVALGSRGADVADMRGQFEALNATIGNDSTKALDALKTSFAGTVSDFDLMKMTNEALSAGLKASASDLGLMGDVARVVADRIGGDASQAFEVLSKAMATGKTKGAELLIGVIDNEAAIANYAKSLRVSASTLSEEQKIAAVSIAIKQRMGEVLSVAGKAEVDFADAVAIATTTVTNLYDALALSVTQAPAVQVLMKTFTEGIQAGFGVDSQQMVQTISGYVNKFAIFLVDVAKVGVDTAGFINVAWNGMKLVFAAVAVAATFVMEAIVTNISRFLNVAEQIPGVGDKFTGVAATARNAATSLHNLRETFVDQTKQAYAGVTANSEFEKKLDTIRGALGTTREAMVKASAEQALMSEGAKTLGASTGTAGTALGTAGASSVAFKIQMEAAKVAVSNLTADQKLNIQAGIELGASNKDIALAVGTTENAVKLYKEQLVNVLKAQKEWDAEVERMAKLVLPPYTGLLETLNAAHVDNVTLIGRTIPEAAKARQEMLDWAKANNVLIPTIEGVGSEAGKTTDAVKTLGQEIGEGLRTTMGNISQTLIDAFKGGGGLSGAFKAIGVQIARDVAEPILARLGEVRAGFVQTGATAGIAAALSGGTWKSQLAQVGVVAVGSMAAAAAMTGATVGSVAAAGALTFGIGAAAIGVVALVRHFTSVSKEIKEARKNVDEFQASIHGTLTAEQKAEAGGEKWKMTMIGVRDVFLQMGHTAQEAELVVAQLLNTDRPKEAFQAMQMINTVWEAHNARIKEAGPLFGELMAAAADAGGQVPEHIRGMVDQMVALGLITDEDAQKFRDLTVEGTVNIGMMTDAAEALGIPLANLGPQFQSGRLDKGFEDVYRNMVTLMRGGTEAGTVISGAKEEINKLVLEARHFGTTIPGYMKPFIDNLLETGQLIGDDGKALTDLAGINFGDPIVNALDRVVTKFEEFMNRILGLNQEVGTNLPDSANRAGRALASAAGTAIDHFGRAGQAVGRFKRDALDDLAEVAGAVDDLNFGTSPGGLKEIPLLLAEASEWSGRFQEDFRRNIEICGGILDTDFIPRVRDLNQELQDLLDAMKFKPGGHDDDTMVTTEQGLGLVHDLFKKYGLSGASQQAIDMMAKRFGYKGGEFHSLRDIQAFLAEIEALYLKDRVQMHRPDEPMFSTPTMSGGGTYKTVGTRSHATAVETNVFLVVDPRSGRISQLNEADFRRLEQAANDGEWTIPARVVRAS